MFRLFNQIGAMVLHNGVVPATKRAIAEAERAEEAQRAQQELAVAADVGLVGALVDSAFKPSAPSIAVRLGSRQSDGSASTVATNHAQNIAAISDASWRYEIRNGTVYDRQTDLTWQQHVGSDSHDWSSAKAYSRALELDGGGWRLPEKEELLSLIAAGSQPTIDPATFPGAPAAWYWTATPHTPDVSVWVVSFAFGRGDFGTLSGRNLLRCVRSGRVTANSSAGGTGLFDQLRAATQQLSVADQAAGLVRIAEMEGAVGQQAFKDRYLDFMSFAARHITTFGPMLPSLTELLAGSSATGGQ